MKESILIPFITFLLGIIITHAWDKFKNRIALLKYTVWHRYLGASVDDSRFGSLKLLYNDKAIKCLYMSTILLSNDSNRDLSDLDINIVANSNSAILVSYGKNKSSFNELLFTDQYNSILSAQRPEDLNIIFGRRDYKLPVLNRADKVEFSLLTTNFEGKQPFITVSCDHQGVKIQYAQVFAELFGESLKHSALVGIFVAILICIPVIYCVNNKVIAVLLALIIGLCASLLGILVIKMYKFMIKFLS